MSHPDEQIWIERGLLDPSKTNASQRLELLTWLTERGLTITEMVEAQRKGQLNALAGDLTLRPGPKMTPRQVAGELGLDIQFIQNIWSLVGLSWIEADDAVITRPDFAFIEMFQSAEGMFSREEIARFVTVLGASLRRIADAAGEMFLQDVEAPLKASNASPELELARANLDGTELARAASTLFPPLFLAHLENSTARTRVARQDSEDYDTVRLAVGFVDLSGFTERSRSMSPRDLRDMITAFERRANQIVSQYDGRIVKLIGDEVMFSAVTAAAGCAIALALTADAPDGTQARGGLAFGEVIASGGDLYGPIVNIASRLADIAIPNEVLVNEAVMEGVQGRVFEPAGRRQLKGFSEPVPLWTLSS